MRPFALIFEVTALLAITVFIIVVAGIMSVAEGTRTA
jgi:hypothetical protein